MESCIYVGEAYHRRLAPVEHSFRHKLSMVYLDLAEWDCVFERRALWSVEGWGLANIRRRDHYGETHVPLDEAIRVLVAEQTGRCVDGPIRVLTQPAYFGYCFNPVSFFYCFEPNGNMVDTIVAEVHNTPWNEQHMYVLNGSYGENSCEQRFRFQKSFHVSPFMDMAHEYDWRFSQPDTTLAVHTVNIEAGERLFQAGITMRRREISSASCRRTLLRFPFMTGRIIGAIYWQAFRLWLKRAPFFTHPDKRVPPAGETT